MPQKTWAIGEEVLAVDFNNYVQTQVVARFATVAARDAAWPAATAGAGAVCVTTDTGTLWTVVGALWVPRAGGRVASGYAAYPQTALVGNTPILAQTPPILPYATRMFVAANGYAGSDTGTMDGITIAVQSTPAYTSPPGVGSTAGRFGHAAIHHSWVVAANASPNFALAVNWITTSGGTTFVVANMTWHRYWE